MGGGHWVEVDWIKALPGEPFTISRYCPPSPSTLPSPRAGAGGPSVVVGRTADSSAGPPRGQKAQFQRARLMVDGVRYKKFCMFRVGLFRALFQPCTTAAVGVHIAAAQRSFLL